MSQEQRQQLRQHCVGMIADIAVHSNSYVEAEIIVAEAEILFEWIETGGIEIPQQKLQAQA